MSDALWPVVHGLSWKLKRKTAFKTAIQPAVASGYETRLNLGGPDPVMGFELEYSILFAGAGPDGQGKNELSQIESFFWKHKGSFDSFLLDAGVIQKDPSESFVVDQTLTVDGNNNAPLVRTKPGSTVTEAIYELARSDDGSLTTPVVKLDDVPLTLGTDYVLHAPANVADGSHNANGITYGGYLVSFLSTPSGRVSADFGWLYRVRFLNDEQEFDMFHYLLWEAQQVQLIGTRTPLAGPRFELG